MFFSAIVQPVLETTSTNEKYNLNGDRYTATERKIVLKKLYVYKHILLFKNNNDTDVH